MPKFEVNLKNSLNTSTVAEDVRAFGDASAPALQNTGIERDGGVTNIYETVESYATAGDHYITEDGNILESVVSGDQRLISVDGRQIGITSAYGVQSRQAFQGVDDACITTTGTVLTAAVKGSGIQVNEYSATGTLLNTRTTTFVNLSAVLQFFTSLSIVRYQGIKFADSLEFGLRLGTQLLVLKESTPGQDIMRSIVSSYNSVVYYCALVYGDWLVIAGDLGRISSFDGSNWHYYDGTGGGSGPYNDGSAMGSSTINCCTVFNDLYDIYLVFAGANGRVCSYRNNGQWNAYNKAGSGLWNNGTVIGANTINAVCYCPSPVLSLAFGGDGGRMGSVTAVAGVYTWYVYTDAATNLVCNATLIGANTIRAINFIRSSLSDSIIVVSGDGGRVGSKRYTGGSWNTKLYTDPTAADNPTNNATVCGAVVISKVTNWGTNDLIFSASSGGRVGMLHAYTWYNYNGAGGAGVCINNATAIGATSITAAGVFGSTFFIMGSNGAYATWDGTNWKNSDGTGAGTGVYGAASILNSGANSVIEYKSTMVSIYILINNVTSANIKNNIITVLNKASNYFESQSDMSYVYVYKYENGCYLINQVGNINSRSFVVDYSGGLTSSSINCAYAVLQIKNGYSRHITTGSPYLPSASVNTVAIVGYTSFTSSFSTSLVYPVNNQPTPTVTKHIKCFNYVEAFFYLAGATTDRYNMATTYGQTVTNFFRIIQSNTETYINGYGKLTNAYEVAPSKQIEFRAGLINGVLSFLSAAVLDGLGSDCMGALLTNVGEIDTTYYPDFQDDRILYRYNGQFFYVILSKTLTGNVFQKIGEKVYKINSISPLNIISMIDQRLHVGSSDYHGQMIFESTAAPSATATNVASVLAGTITGDPLAENIYSNSIDVGDKLCYITSPTSANISLVGYRIPYGYQSIQEMISTYIADTYAFSTANDGSELVLTDPNNPVYVADTRLPVAIGLQYYNGTVSNGQTTIFLQDNYDGYELGNEAKGVYQAFQLYGVVYLYDGVTVYQATINNGIYAGKIAIASAVGMTFIAATPTQAYFLSAYDNSVYVFNGGRALTKFQRLTQLPAVLKGIYSTRDNALLLETASSFIWVRDEIVTTNAKSAAQTSLILYDTTAGLRMGNDVSNWRYTYLPYSGSSTVVPLVWQSSYYGAENLDKANVRQIMATVYSPSRESQTIGVEVSGFDERQHYSQKKFWSLTASDYSSSGYARLKISPLTQKTLGQGVTLTIPKKTVITDVMFEYDGDAKATVTDNRTA